MRLAKFIMINYKLSIVLIFEGKKAFIREASKPSGHTLRNSRAPFPIIAPNTDTLEQTDANFIRCRYRGPAWVARVHYVLVHVMIHSHVHSPMVTIRGFRTHTSWSASLHAAPDCII